MPDGVAPFAVLFQSTLSVRRATDIRRAHIARTEISIHALRKESDSRMAAPSSSLSGFQSTLSVRRATGAHITVEGLASISIHALRKESD